MFFLLLMSSLSWRGGGDGDEVNQGIWRFDDESSSEFVVPGFRLMGLFFPSLGSQSLHTFIIATDCKGTMELVPITGY